MARHVAKVRTRRRAHDVRLRGRPAAQRRPLLVRARGWEGVRVTLDEPWACLQVALELVGCEMMVAAVAPDGVVERAELGMLLPRGPYRG